MIRQIATLLLASMLLVGCGGGSCGQRRECCEQIASAEQNGTVAYIRGACRVDLTSSRVCSSSMNNIHDRIRRSPGDVVPAACQP